MYCQNCGKLQEDRSAVCNNCGEQLITKKDFGFNNKSSFWFAFLSFLFPFAGFILYLIYEDKKPKRSKSLKKGFIAGIVIRIIIIVVLLILSAILINRSAADSKLLFDTLSAAESI